MKRRVLLSTFALACLGTALSWFGRTNRPSPPGPIHNLSDDAVLRGLPKSPGTIVRVRAAQEEFLGYQMKLPLADSWRTLNLQGSSLKVIVPDQPLQEFSMEVREFGNESQILMYPVFQGQFGISAAVTIELQRLTPQALEEYRTKEGAFIKEYLKEDSFATWEKVTSHETLSTLEKVAWQTSYRKDVPLKNKDVVRVTARVQKYCQHPDGSSLFPVMDRTVRKVIESVTSSTDPP